MGWLEITLIAIAAVFMAVNQAVKDATDLKERFPSLRFPGWANYVPLALIVAAGCIHLAKLIIPNNGLPASSSPQSSPQPASSEKLAPSSVSITGLSAERVMGFHEGRTNAEAQRLVAPFVGAVAEVTGSVKDVYEVYDGFVGVSLGGNNPYPSTKLLFEPKFSAAILRLQLGDSLTAKCVFKGDASAVSISFKDCQLIRPAYASPPPSNNRL